MTTIGSKTKSYFLNILFRFIYTDIHTQHTHVLNIYHRAIRIENVNSWWPPLIETGLYTRDWALAARHPTSILLHPYTLISFTYFTCRLSRSLAGCIYISCAAQVSGVSRSPRFPSSAPLSHTHTQCTSLFTLQSAYPTKWKRLVTHSTCVFT